MPPKSKKSSTPHAADRSPRPTRTPSAPSSPAPAAIDDALHHQRLLAAAAAEFPALISEASAVCARVSEAEAAPLDSNYARVWLSEAAMVASSLAPGSLVSVSLASSGNSSMSDMPLDNLVEECAKYFGFDVDNHIANLPGSYFAIALAFPSRKVHKNGIRLSWGLSCTMGFPGVGRAVFICPLGNFIMSDLLKVDTVVCKQLWRCKDLYLNLMPPKAELVPDTSVNPIRLSNENEILGSPKMPSAPYLKSSKDLLPTSKTRFTLDVSAFKLALQDEKVRELIEVYCGRWLCDRHLLKGNFVTVPLCGQMCVFQVEGANKLSEGNPNVDHEKLDSLSVETDTSCLNQSGAALLVDSKTKVHLSATSFELETPEAVQYLPEDVRYTKVSQKKGGVVPKLGGLSKEFAALKEIILFSLMRNDAVLRYKGVLLYGPPGTGKTSLASFCTYDAGVSLFSINGPEIISQYYGESEQALYEVFDSARKAAPSVVFIDELDAIAPARKEGGEELSLRMVATLLKLMDEINLSDRVLLIAATNRPDSIDPALRRPGRLDREIEIGVPSPEQRLDILHALLGAIDHSLSNTDVHSLALATHGFVGADLAALCNEAAMTALRRYIRLVLPSNLNNNNFLTNEDAIDMQDYGDKINGDVPSKDQIDTLVSSISLLSVSPKYEGDSASQRTLEKSSTWVPQHSKSKETIGELLLQVTVDDFECAKMKVRPSALREVMLELPKVRWEDVGGQAKVKKQLIEAVQWPQMCPDAFKRIGIRPPRGLLMIGPPGCSKTLMARAVASEAKLNFLAVKGPELFSKWVGESEKAVKALFAKARANSPAIIFFDEIDGLAVTRGQDNDGTSVADRVLSQLLVEMDGLGRNNGVTVIAATNRPDKIDPALLRPGRFDRLLDVLPPDEDDRQDIFHIHLRNMPCSADVKIRDLAQMTEGYTGADIKLVCREAAIAALEESLDISEVTMTHFKVGVSRVQPSNVQFYRELSAQFQRLVDTPTMKDE